jgi:hypothetical protein
MPVINIGGDNSAYDTLTLAELTELQQHYSRNNWSDDAIEKSISNKTHKIYIPAPLPTPQSIPPVSDPRRPRLEDDCVDGTPIVLWMVLVVV